MGRAVMVHNHGRKQRARDDLRMHIAVALGAAICGVLRAGMTMAALAQLGSGFPPGHAGGERDRIVRDRRRCRADGA